MLMHNPMGLKRHLIYMVHMHANGLSGRCVTQSCKFYKATFFFFTAVRRNRLPGPLRTTAAQFPSESKQRGHTLTPQRKSALKIDRVDVQIHLSPTFVYSYSSVASLRIVEQQEQEQELELAECNQACNFAGAASKFEDGS